MFSSINGIRGKQRSAVRAAMCFYTLSTWLANSSKSYLWVYHFISDLFTSGFGGGGVATSVSLSVQLSL